MKFLSISSISGKLFCLCGTLLRKINTKAVGEEHQLRRKNFIQILKYFNKTLRLLEFSRYAKFISASPGEINLVL